MAERWTVPRCWHGKTVAILACGPSMSSAVASAAAASYPTIGINDAGLRFACDVLYFCDRRWYEWHALEVEARRDVFRVTLENYEIGSTEIKHLHNYGRDGLQLDPRDGLRTGKNSGYQAINLAILLGAKTIRLYGYDMRFVDGRSHFHEGHPVPLGADVFDRNHLPMFDQLPALIKPLGVEIENCTPGSALKVFPFAENCV